MRTTEHVYIRRNIPLVFCFDIIQLRCVFQEKFMTFNAQSSGDLIADRRSDYARMLAGAGDFQAAVDLIEQALEVTPLWPAGWFKLGEYAEKINDRQKAIRAYQRLMELDKPGVFGASLKLAVLGMVEAPDQMPSIYVAGLFDDYADRFETSLVTKLNYTVPENLTGLILKNFPKDHQFNCVVDLGCGTGLFATAFKDHAERLEGFDISSNMLAKADEKSIYSHLAIADLTLEGEKSGLFSQELTAHRADLVAATDVMMYLGQLDNVMALATDLLAPRGYLAFSIEEATATHAYFLQPSLRYAHSQSYVASVLTSCGYDLVAQEKTTIRTDGGKPIFGILFLARKRS
jgi:predicted TPR repeat methyltransferase